MNLKDITNQETYINKNHSSSNKKFSIIILAAGLGKRMNNPQFPKVMAQLAGRPLIGYVLETAGKLNPEKIVLIVGHGRELVIEYVTNLHLGNISFAVQEQQLGTGHAAAQAESDLSGFDGNVLILSGDVPMVQSNTLLEFIENHGLNEADASVLTTIAPIPKGYGRVIRTQDGNFVKITEDKDATEEEKQISEINSGIYFIKSPLLFSSLRELKNNNAQGEYYLTDIIEILRNKNYKVKACCLDAFDQMQGINTVAELETLEAKLITNY